MPRPQDGGKHPVSWPAPHSGGGGGGEGSGAWGLSRRENARVKHCSSGRRRGFGGWRSTRAKVHGRAQQRG